MSKTPSLWKTFLVFLAPLMLSNALQSLFGTVSNALLGQMIGVDALAAVSVCFPVMFFLFAFVMGLSTGATVLIGQAWGAGERDTVKAVAGATLAVGLLLSITVALFGGLFSRRLMTALATPPDILDQASAYARVMLMTMPLGFIFLLTTAMLRGRTSRHRLDGPGVGVGYFHRADAGRAQSISASQEESAGAGRRVCAQASAGRRAARQNPGHRNPERGRDGGDGDRRTGATRPRQRFRF